MLPGVVFRHSFTLVFLPALALTVPDVPVVPILMVTIPIVALGPVVAYPWSKTIWMAVDRAVLQQLDGRERLDERH